MRNELFVHTRQDPKWGKRLLQVTNNVTEESLPSIIQILSTAPAPLLLATAEDSLTRRGLAHVLKEGDSDVLGGFLSHLEDKRDGPQSDKVEIQKVKNAIKICELLKKYCATLPPSSLRDRAVSLARNVSASYESFLSYSSFAGTHPDSGLLPATLDERDVRSVARRTNLEGVVHRNVHLLRIDEKLVGSYRDKHLLNPMTAEYVLHKIPVEVTENFLGLFSHEEAVKHFNIICSENVAHDVSSDPHNHDYLVFIAELVVQGNYPEDADVRRFRDDENPKGVSSFAKTLYKHIPGPHESRAQTYLRLKTSFQLEKDDVLTLLRNKKYPIEVFERDYAAYAPPFSGSDLITFRDQGIEISDAVQLRERMPPMLQGGETISYCLKNPSVRTRLNSTLLADLRVFFADIEIFTIDMLDWYLSNPKRNKKLAKSLREVGVQSMEHIYGFAKWLEHSRVPLSYVRQILRVCQFSEERPGAIHSALKYWHLHRMRPEEVVAAQGVWDEDRGVPWFAVDPQNIRDYLAIKKNQRQTELMERVCEKYDWVPAEVVVHIRAGATEQNFDDIEELELLSGWVSVIQAWPEMKEEWKHLSDDLEAAVVARGPKKLLEAKRANTNFTFTNYAEACLVETRRGIYRSEETARYVDVLAPSPENVAHVKLLRLFEISPEYMEEQLLLESGRRKLDDVSTNHIILCAYIEKKIPQYLIPLIEVNNIRYFTRYPAESLRNMARGFPETSQKKTALILRAKSEYRPSRDSMHNEISQLSEGYNVNIFEVGTKKDIATALKHIGFTVASQGKKIDLIMFDGHGSENVFQMGYPYSNFSTHLTVPNVRYLAPYRALLSEDAQCIIAACSTARGGRDADGLAYALSESWRGVEVFASNDDTNLRKVILDEEKRLKSVEFADKSHLEVIKS